MRAAHDMPGSKYRWQAPNTPIGLNLGLYTNQQHGLVDI